MDGGLPDLAITFIIQNLGQWLLYPMLFFSFLGTEGFVLIGIPAIYWCIESSLGLRLGMMLLLTNSINYAIKLFFHLPRPYWISHEVKAYSSEISFGLPSGHSQNAAGIFGILAERIRRKWVTILCVILVFLVGISRIYLGVHYSLDVLAGWILGAVVLFIFLFTEKPLLNWFSQRSYLQKHGLVLLSSILLTSLPLLARFLINQFNVPIGWSTNAINAYPGNVIDPLSIENGFTIGGTWLGMLSGTIFLEYRFGTWSVHGTIKNKVLRYIIGCIGIGIIWAGLKLVLPSSLDPIGYFFRYVRYTFTGFWVTAIAPYIFHKIKLVELSVERS